MSKQDFESIKPQLEAIPWKEVKTPKMPVGTLLQEAFDLYEWAKDDEQALLRAGLDKNLLHELPVRARALRHIQSQWSKVLAGDVEDMQKWKEAKGPAIRLRSELLHALQFACRGDDSGILKSLREIKKGNSKADLIQDLNDLSVVGQSHRKSLEEVGYDPTNLDRASQMCTELGILSAKADIRDVRDIKYMRDRAAVYLRLAVKEVRTVGRFAFRGDSKRLQGYQHRYFSRK